MYVLYVCVYEKCVNKVTSAVANLLSTVLHECTMYVMYVCMYVLCMIVLYVRMCIYTVGRREPPSCRSDDVDVVFKHLLVDMRQLLAPCCGNLTQKGAMI